MVNIENDVLTVIINEQGAELDRIYHKKFSLDYLWEADPAFWAKKSPVLFPIVGGLKNNKYIFEGWSYELGRHGFARESLFKLVDHSNTSASFKLSSSEKTRAVYPFDFSFFVNYALNGDSLTVTFRVENTGSRLMYFSVGGHPAFKVPLEENSSYEDYYLEFSELEDAGRWPLTKDGLIKASPLPLLENERKLNLSKELFAEDALVFKNLRSDSVALKSTTAGHGIHFSFPGFPFFGIWAARNADFVCIEPWCGLADSELTTQQLTEKEGIQLLEQGANFERSWTVTMF